MLVVQEPDPGGGVSSPHRLYPRPGQRSGWRFRPGVRRFHGEAVAWLRSAKSYTATALMCRRVIETIAADLGKPSKKDTLARTLKVLSDLANSIRGATSGPQSCGRWATTPHTAWSKMRREQMPSDALAFTEAIMVYVYTYRAKFDEYRKRLDGIVAPKRPSWH